MGTRSKSKTSQVATIGKSATPKAGAANQGSLFSLANIRKPVGTPADDSQPSLKAGAIEVHKPSKNDIVRVHPDAGERLARFPVFEFKQSTEFLELYLIMSRFRDSEEIAELVSYVNLFRGINQMHVEFVWPVKTGDDRWNQSSQEAVYLAMKKVGFACSTRRQITRHGQ